MVPSPSPMAHSITTLCPMCFRWIRWMPLVPIAHPRHFFSAPNQIDERKLNKKFINNKRVQDESAFMWNYPSLEKGKKNYICLLRSLEKVKKKILWSWKSLVFCIRDVFFQWSSNDCANRTHCMSLIRIKSHIFYFLGWSSAPHLVFISGKLLWVYLIMAHYKVTTESCIKWSIESICMLWMRSLF